MPSFIKIMKTLYYACNLFLSLFFFSLYLRWSLWRAKIGFKKELEREGVPRNAAQELISFYDGQNKKLIRHLIPYSTFFIPDNPRLSPTRAHSP
jgi:hypothetical protein